MRKPNVGDVVKLVPTVSGGYWLGGLDAWPEWKPLVGQVIGTVTRLVLNEDARECAYVLLMGSWRVDRFRLLDLEVTDGEAEEG